MRMTSCSGSPKQSRVERTEHGRAMMALDELKHDFVRLQMICGVFAIALTAVNPIYIPSEKRNHGAASSQRRYWPANHSLDIVTFSNADGSSRFRSVSVGFLGVAFGVPMSAAPWMQVNLGYLLTRCGHIYTIWNVQSSYSPIPVTKRARVTIKQATRDNGFDQPPYFALGACGPHSLIRWLLSCSLFWDESRPSRNSFSVPRAVQQPLVNVNMPTW